MSEEKVLTDISPPSSSSIDGGDDIMMLMCRSCKHRKPLSAFDGKATCNVCRPIKKQKIKAYRQRKQALEGKTRRDQTSGRGRSLSPPECEDEGCAETSEEYIHSTDQMHQSLEQIGADLIAVTGA